MQHDVRQLVREREAASVGIVQGVDADDRHAIPDAGHA
jgi:hypothetical protein